MFNILDEISKYDVNWGKPGRNDRGAMPIGNGNTVLNLWTEEEGDLQFYFCRSDSLTELDRNVKLGKIRVSFSSNPFKKGCNFNQRLDLVNGCIDIIAGSAGDKIELKIFISTEDDSIYIKGNCEKPTTITATYTNWRTEPVWQYIDSTPLDERSCESPDIVKTREESILFYHKNGLPNIKWQLRHLELLEYSDKCHDLLTNRIFGGIMSLTGAKSIDDGKLEAKDKKEFLVKISTDSNQTDNLDDFISTLQTKHDNSSTSDFAYMKTCEFWNAYWQKSYVFIDGDEKILPKTTDEFKEWSMNVYDDKHCPESSATSAYVLTKFMFECNALGSHPIRFNGLNYLVMPQGGVTFNFGEFAKSLSADPIGEPTMQCNPDQRPWGDITLWQNVRLPYYSMLSRGEYKEIKVLFDYYMSFKEINRGAAKVFYDAEGQYNTEITMSYGSINAYIYGINREGKNKGYAENRWGGALDISPGLELVCLMLDYCEYTGDVAYLNSEVIPYAVDLLLYIKTRFKNRDNGKIDISPLHVLETYFDTKNPVTVVGGMHSVINRILKLENLKEKEFFIEMKSIIPEMSFTKFEDKTIIKVADEYSDSRNNVELPELYMVYPFRYYGIGKPGFDIIKDTYYAMKKHGNYTPYLIGAFPGAPSYSGWQYVGMAAASLCIREDVREIVQNNVSLHNPAYRFPAMWGPVYDSVPDVDHGANILNTIQLSLLQFDEEKIYLLPSLPSDWNVQFKLFAPKNTIVECKYTNGKIDELKVTPEIRSKDIILLNQ